MGSRWSFSTDIERFEEKVLPITETGCWIWMGSTAGNRYGSFYYPNHPSKEENDNKMISAHRAALYLYEGVVPDEGLEVLHKCDVTFCCNPSHLSIGTHQDNMTDMVNKGRSPQNQRKLTDEEILEARSLRAKGIEVKEVAAIFGISSSHMSRVTRGSFRKGARKPN